jgi:hypothetical protein
VALLRHYSGSIKALAFESFYQLRRRFLIFFFFFYFHIEHMLRPSSVTLRVSVSSAVSDEFSFSFAPSIFPSQFRRW